SLRRWVRVYITTALDICLSSNDIQKPVPKRGEVLESRGFFVLSSAVRKTKDGYRKWEIVMAAISSDEWWTVKNITALARKTQNHVASVKPSLVIAPIRSPLIFGGHICCGPKLLHRLIPPSTRLHNDVGLEFTDCIVETAAIFPLDCQSTSSITASTSNTPLPPSERTVKGAHELEDNFGVLDQQMVNSYPVNSDEENEILQAVFAKSRETAQIEELAHQNAANTMAGVGTSSSTVMESNRHRERSQEEIDIRPSAVRRRMAVHSSTVSSPSASSAQELFALLDCYAGQNTTPHAIDVDASGFTTECTARHFINRLILHAGYSDVDIELPDG
ncbi:hypothetical protein F5878DRAFT_648047, partial [Lentinula raphanica]